MAVVTVLGAHGAVMLTYSASENAVLAARLAAAISAGVANSSIAPADSQDGPDVFRQFADQFRDDPDWRFQEMNASHSPNITDPQALADVLLAIA